MPAQATAEGIRISRTLKALVWLPPLALLGALLAIALEHPVVVVEMPQWVLSATVLFVAIVCFPIAALAGRSYVATGDPGLLWLGCGAIVWAFSGLVANALAPIDINAAVTAHNLLAWLSAACHLVGVFVVPRPQARPSASWTRLGAAALAALLVVGGVATAAGAGLTPPFFVPGTGGTPLRYGVLGSAALMFVFSAAMLIRERGHEPASFSYWYSIGLLIIAVGLAAVMMQAYPRSPIAWVGRIAQVIGTAYMLGAVLAATRNARAIGVPVAIALHEAEQRFDDLIEMAPYGVLVHELPGDAGAVRILRANPAACALLGHAPATLTRLAFDEILAPRERGIVGFDRAKLGRGERVMQETTLVAGDGREVPVEIGTRLARFDGRDAAITIVHDVSERRRSDEERAHLAAIVEHSRDAIIAATLGGVVTDWNRGAADLFGYEAAEIVGRPLSALFPAEDLAAGQPMRAALEHARPLSDVDTFGIRRDASRVALSVTMSPIRDRTGRLAGISLIARDVTAKRQSEEMLASAKTAAEEANRAKTTFLANMSHEIRTPLHNIVGLAELLRRDASDQVQKQRIHSLSATADHMMSVINDILELSRIEANRVVLDHRDFALADVLDGTVAVIRETARAKGLGITVDVAPGLRGMVLRGDGLRLRQVLINLASNAVKFTDRGSIEISVVQLADAPSGPRLRFAVKDTGIGIDPANQARIFRAFEQADVTDGQGNRGSGLGLAICDGLVQAMGGHIEVASTPGSGSTFAFALPFAHGSGVPDAASATPTTSLRFDGSHVLIADDNMLSRAVLAEMLLDLGCTVDVAIDGEDALRKARAAVYDLIILDIQMPGLDGLSAARAVRELPEHGYTPILALTASALAEDRQRCLDAQMNGYLRKPVTGATLRAELVNWLAPSSEPVAIAASMEDRSPGRGEPSPHAGGQAMLAGDADGRARDRLMRDYVSLHRPDLAELRRHLAAGRHVAARQLLHTLEGSAAMIGAREIEVAAAALAAELRDGAESSKVEVLARACESGFEQLAQASRPA